MKIKLQIRKFLEKETKGLSTDKRSIIYLKKYIIWSIQDHFNVFT